MNEKKFKIRYRGSWFWLIFWLILFFPVGFALLFTSSSFETSKATYDFKYDGSRFWVAFWTLFFFPIAIILLFLNGFSVTTTPATPLPPSIEGPGNHTV